MTNKPTGAAIALAAFTLAVGCTEVVNPGMPITPVVADGAPAEWLPVWADKVRTAATAWDTAIGPSCLAQAGLPNGVFPIPDGTTEGFPVELIVHSRWPFPHGVAGRTIYDQGIYVKGPESDAQLGLLVDVLTHELGHALGLEEHSDDPKDVMFREGRGVFTPTANDARRARRALGCTDDSNSE